MKLLLSSMFIVLLLVLPQEFVEATGSATLDSLSTVSSPFNIYKLLELRVSYVALLRMFQVIMMIDVHIKEGDVDEAELHKMYRRPKINCEFACARRCREASRVKVCARACGSCCARCQCVPPGTYGNKAACPCYATLKTHGSKPKCP
ncbi:hypothetical protein Syun_003050 [Stephania yunnanensis]|uniref:Uncharacterized protein n=1 Tax=Stephania yunnanensis TaxID=152371 RepID=A0AAP0L0H7_9MAGN